MNAAAAGRRRRVLHIAGGVLGTPLAVLGVAILLAAMPWVRVRLAHHVLNRLQRTVPGSLAVDHLAWPTPGHLLLEGVSWINEGDTLLACARAEIRIDLLALVRGDIHLDDVRVEALRGDLPAISATSTPGPSKKTRFPRPGAIGELPSVGVETFYVTVAGLALSDSFTVHEAVCAGSVENRHGKNPHILLREFLVRAPPGSMTSSGPVEIDARRGMYRASVSVQVAEGWRMLVDMKPAGPDALILSVIRAVEDTTAQPYGVWATCSFDRSDRFIEGITFRGHALLPGSDDLAPPVGSGEKPAFPHVPRTRLSLSGSFRWQQGVVAELRLEATPNEIVQEGLARLTVEARRVMLDTLRVVMPGIRMDLEGELLDSLVRGRGVAALTNPAAAAAWLNARVVGDLTSARLSVNVAGPIRAPSIEGLLTGGGRLGDMVVDSIRLDLSAPAFLAAPAVFSLNGWSGSQHLYTRGHVDADRHLLRAELEPIQLLVRHVPPAAQKSHGSVTANLVDKTVRFTGIRVVGDQGILTCSGSLGPGTDNSVHARGEWPRMPAFLEAELGLAERSTQQAAAAWTAAGPFFIDVRADIAPHGSAPHSIRGTVRLPGLAQFAALQPQADLSTLGPVEGTFTAHVDSLFHIMAHARLTAPGWIDSAVVRLHTVGDIVAVDTLDVGLFLGHIAGSGTIGGTGNVFAAHAALPDLRLIRRLIPSLPPDLAGRVSVEARYYDDGDAQNLWTTASGSMGAAGIQIPSMEGKGSWGPDGGDLALVAPQGVQIDGLDLTHVTVRYAGSSSLPALPGTLLVEASGDDVEALSRLTITHEGNAWIAKVDSLRLRFETGAMASLAPFVVDYDPSRNALTVDGLSMSGESGSIYASGTLSPDGSKFLARIMALLPDQSRTVRIPPLLRGAQIQAELRSTGTDSLTATWQITGPAMPGGGMIVSGGIRVGRNGLTLSAAGRQSSDRDAVSGILTAPLRIALWPPRAEWGDGPIHGAVTAEGMLLPLGGPNLAGAAVPFGLLNGALVVGGTMNAPRGELDATLSLPRRKNEPERSVIFHAEVTPSMPGETTIRPDAPLGASPHGLIIGEMVAVSGHETVMVAAARSPVLLSMVPPRLAWPDTAMVDLTIRAPRFPLSAVNGYIPDRTELKGTCAFDLRVSGPATLPVVEGTLVAREAQVRLVDGTKVTADLHLTVGGSVARPEVRGSISVLNGVILLPESPREVHDVEGEALLWEIPSAGYGAPPGYAAASARDPDRHGSDSSPVIPDVDIALAVPGGLWVRGQGLNAEVAGDLRLAYRTGPVLTGTLRTVQGRLDYLGRTFTLERGSVAFYGEDPPDPVVDIVVRAKVAEATFQITMGGTLSEPLIELSSEPEMPEAEIVSYLVLGRPTDMLSTGQLGLIKERLTQIASLRGVGELQAMVSRTLGLDLVTVGEGSASGTDDALVLGKYLSPRLLVGYERGLAGDSQTYITLEYLISEFLRLKTWTGDNGDSSIEISLTKDY